MLKKMVFTLLILAGYANGKEVADRDIVKEPTQDIIEQRKIDSITQIQSLTIFIVPPYMENHHTQSEDEFKHDACQYNSKSESANQELWGNTKKANIRAISKPVGWGGPIVGLYFLDKNGEKHSLLFDQNYPSQEKINGYFDAHPVRANAFLISSIYQTVAKMEISSNCEYFIKPFRAQ